MCLFETELLVFSLDNLVSGKRRTRGTPTVSSSLPRSSRKQRITHETTSENPPAPQSTPATTTGGGHETLTTPFVSVTEKEEIGQLAPTCERSSLREMEEQSASTKKRPGRLALGTAEKRSKKQQTEPKATSTPTPKRGRPRKQQTEGTYYTEWCEEGQIRSVLFTPLNMIFTRIHS